MRRSDPGEPAGRRPGLLALLGLLGLLGPLGLLAACSQSGPSRRPAREAAPREVLLRHLPFSVESEQVLTPVRGEEETYRVPNRAYALFDQTSIVTRVRQRAAGGRIALVQRSEVSGTDLVAANARGEVVDESVDLERRREMLAVARDRERRVVRTVARSDRVGLETTSDRTSTEQSSTREGTERSSVRDATETARAVTRSEGHLAWASRRESRVEFEGQEELKEFLLRHEETLRVRSESLARIVRQDKLLRRFFELSQDELRERIHEETRAPEREAVRLEKAISVEEIVPGETFDYVLTLENVSESPVRRVVFYDEFPVGLLFENRYEGLLERADGTDAQFSEKQDLVSLLTPNQWEQGKIAWFVPDLLGPGDTIRFRFRATWYRERGVPGREGAELRAEPSADARVVGRATRDDVLFIASRSLESDLAARADAATAGADGGDALGEMEDPAELAPLTAPDGVATPGAGFLLVSLRRGGSGERVDGYLRAADFVPEEEVDATDLERRLQESVWLETDDAPPAVEENTP